MPSVALTRALVSRHAAGRADAYDAALLDVAQDHLLWLLAQLGLFEGDELVFKGGTSLRKCRLGGAGRFSTDLDFAAPDDDTVLRVCEAIDGAVVAGFSFRLSPTRGDGRHWTLSVDHAELGRPAVGASVEFARRPLIRPPENLPFVELAVHRAYEIDLPILPVIAESEACAEKLARYRRVALQRDVYDLARLTNRAIDEQLVRRLWVLKVWGDVVDDRRGSSPLSATEVLSPKSPHDSRPIPSACSHNRSISSDGNVELESDSDSLMSSMKKSAAGHYVIPDIAGRSMQQSPVVGSLPDLVNSKETSQLTSQVQVSTHLNFPHGEPFRRRHDVHTLVVPRPEWQDLLERIDFEALVVERQRFEGSTTPRFATLDTSFFYSGFQSGLLRGGRPRSIVAAADGIVRLFLAEETYWELVRKLPDFAEQLRCRVEQLEGIVSDWAPLITVVTKYDTNDPRVDSVTARDATDRLGAS